MRRPARRLRTALAALAVAGTLAGCGAFGDAPSQSGGEPRPEGQAIRVGLPTGVTSFANADLAVAIEKGFLSEAGLTVEAQNLRSGVSVLNPRAPPKPAFANATSRRP